MLLVVIGLVFLAATDAVTLQEEYEADYFANVSLPCNFTLHGFLYPGLNVPIKRYWVLPNGTVIPDTFTGDGRFILYSPTPYDFTLIASGIDDSDFGVYHCAVLWNNFDYKIDVIKIGLNVDGPYYEKRLEEFKSNVIIGGAIAGTVFAVVVIGCIVCSCRNSSLSRDREKRQGVDQSAKLRSVYEYGSSTGMDRAGLDGKHDQSSNAELYAKVDKRGSMTDNRSTEEPSSQTVHF